MEDKKLREMKEYLKLKKILQEDNSDEMVKEIYEERD